MNRDRVRHVLAANRLTWTAAGELLWNPRRTATSTARCGKTGAVRHPDGHRETASTSPRMSLPFRSEENTSETPPSLPCPLPGDKAGPPMRSGDFNQSERKTTRRKEYVMTLSQSQLLSGGRGGRKLQSERGPKDTQLPSLCTEHWRCQNVRSYRQEVENHGRLDKLILIQVCLWNKYVL